VGVSGTNMAAWSGRQRLGALSMVGDPVARRDLEICARAQVFFADGLLDYVRSTRFQNGVDPRDLVMYWAYCAS
jgi:hypothetical protein